MPESASDHTTADKSELLPSVSIVVPAYEASAIVAQELPAMLAAMQGHCTSLEVIVADDGSTDWAHTEKITLANGCRFVRLPNNQGKGSALRQGFAVATGDILLFTDCDVPFAYANMLAAITQVAEGQAAVCIGDRTLPASQYYLQISRIRKMGSNLIAFVGSRLLQGHIRDTQCGLKAFSRQAADMLFADTITQRFGIDFELLYLATRYQLPIGKVPVQLRVSYPSTLRILRDGLRTFAEIITAIVYHARRRKKNRRQSSH